MARKRRRQRSEAGRAEGGEAGGEIEVSALMARTESVPETERDRAVTTGGERLRQRSVGSDAGSLSGFES